MVKGEKRRQEKREAEQTLIKQIRKVFKDTNRIYGCRRLRKALLAEGIELSEWKVRHIMQENGMYPETLKKYRSVKNGSKDGMGLSGNSHGPDRSEKQPEYEPGKACYAAPMQDIEE